MAVKEVQEISRIFESYEITLNKMRNVGLYQKSEINQLQEIKHRLNIKGKVVSGAQNSNSTVDVLSSSAGGRGPKYAGGADGTTESM